jgi:hypothetical protein
VGAHNRLNAATALLLALALRLDGVHAAALTAALPTLQPPPHRMQVVGEVDGVLWVDDSKVTLTAVFLSPAVRGSTHCGGACRDDEISRADGVWTVLWISGPQERCRQGLSNSGLPNTPKRTSHAINTGPTMATRGVVIWGLMPRG